MIKDLIASLLGGVGLSWLSLIDKDEIPSCDAIELCLQAKRSGFPFSFVEHNEYLNNTASTFNIFSALINLLFWAVIAFFLIKIVFWVLEKFSILVLFVVVITIAAGYVGLLQVV